MTAPRTRLERVLLYATFLISLGLLTWTIVRETGSQNIAYVNIGKLVDGYRLKKDLEGASSQDLLRIKAVIDSLELQRKVSVSPDGSSPVDQKLGRAKEAFQQYYAASNQQISQKIWDRLNPLLEEYGKKNGLRLLIGANGQGTVLYGGKEVDATDDVLRFINTRYEKGS